MSAQIINGKLLAEAEYKRIKEDADRVYKQIGRKPKLIVILASGDPSSLVYVDAKGKRGYNIGVDVEVQKHNQNVSTDKIVDLIEKMNASKLVDGVIVQQPLYPHLHNEKIINSINPSKDVDGLTSSNLGKIFRSEEPLFFPCTARGIMQIIDSTQFGLVGKNVVVIGRSNIVGKPVAMMMLDRSASVSILHSKTKTIDLEEYCRNADVIVSAVGKPKILGAGMVKEGVFIVDVGISRVNGKLVGDVDFDLVVQKADYITPVPGGVGPMTVMNLMANVVLAATRKMGDEKDL